MSEIDNLPGAEKVKTIENHLLQFYLDLDYAKLVRHLNHYDLCDRYEDMFADHSQSEVAHKYLGTQFMCMDTLAGDVAVCALHIFHYALMDKFDVLAWLRDDEGAQMALDDFGNGYAKNNAHKLNIYGAR